jgi:predicted NUDIX family NTP pyrophosphohydrolase
MPPLSAGVLLYRRAAGGVEVLLVHPGGPFWRNKDRGWWQIPKGLIEAGEAPIVAARREAEEELGVRLEGTPEPLGRIKQAGGKLVDAFALEQDIDPAAIVSNLFEVEWPPRSGTMRMFPEVDRAAWYSLADAAGAILASQRPLLERLAALVG